LDIQILTKLTGFSFQVYNQYRKIIHSLWGRSVVRTQLLVFEQRRRAELYAKHSEAQGNRSVVKTQLLVFEQRRRAELYAKHSEAQGNLV